MRVSSEAVFFAALCKSKKCWKKEAVLLRRVVNSIVKSISQLPSDCLFTGIFYELQKFLDEQLNLSIKMFFLTLKKVWRQNDICSVTPNGNWLKFLIFSNLAFLRKNFKNIVLLYTKRHTTTFRLQSVQRVLEDSWYWNFSVFFMY